MGRTFGTAPKGYKHVEAICQRIHDNIAYAVLSFGGFLGMGEKLFAVPWNALTLSTKNKRFVLSVEKDSLKDALGLDKDQWPNMADQSWVREIHTYYGTKPYSDEPRA